MIALMPALVSLTLPCAPPKLLRRAYACDSKLSRLVVGACCDDFDNSITSLMRKAGKGAPTVADVLEMFYNIRHWRKFNSEKVLIEDIKLIINSTRYSSQVFAIGDLAELMQMVYELCPRLKRFDIVLNCLSCSFAETTRKEMFRGRTNVNHFTLHLSGIERHVEFEAVVNVCLQMLPETVESIGLSISTTNVGCVKRFVNKIRSLEDISRFSYLDVVHFQIEGLPCFEVLLIEVSRSLETMREISILSAPLCRHRKELISNLKIFVTKMRNMKLLRINEQCLRLLLNANLDRRYALHKLCKEIGYKGVIESGRMPGLGEWEDGDGQFVQENVTLVRH
ncbi:unnamed protein product [Toxocara canis]|uniref:FBD domain-containing protein n=1 Tax=Toxocara canis TaxID=6265 RepID=A0A183TYG8_TOXCA|nr:unnamed protein product [Toxocara canis]